MRRDIDYPHEAESGDWGLIRGEWYAVPPGYISFDETLPFIYLERPANPPWIVTDHGNGTITVDPEFRLGDHAITYITRLTAGRWQKVVIP